MIRGERVRALRESWNLSQRELAQKLEYGIATIQRIERGESDPSSDLVGKLAQFFGVSTDFLYGFVNESDQVFTDRLTDKEKEAVFAWRKGDMVTAVKLIVSDS